MRIFHRIFTILFILGFATSFSACATIDSIDHASGDSPKIYSGTRLNIHAINNNTVALKKYNVAPPRYPLLDLPASVMMDTIILPLTTSATLFEDLIY